MRNSQALPSLQTSRRLRLLMLPVLVIGALGGALRPASLHAAESSYSSYQQSNSQQELDRLLAPIALYPDTLLSQILMASTYPLEVVEASRWSRANSRLRGEDAVRAVAREDWDPSVKSLVAFPQILSMMDEKLDWTKQLGDAFLADEPQVMDTVQALRQRAMVAGNLQSNEQIRVARNERIIVIEPASPQVVYVPYYDPLVIYGAWWWPAPPVYWAAWHGYHPRPGVRGGFYWGSGITFSANLFFGGFDWPRRQVVHNHYTVVNRTVVVNRAPQAWRHDPVHRHGVPYRSTSVQQRFASTDHDRNQRRDFDRDRRPDFKGQRQAGPVGPVGPGSLGGPRDNGRDRDDSRDRGPIQRQDARRPGDGDRTQERNAGIQRPADSAPQARPDRGPERRDADNRRPDRSPEARRDEGRRDVTRPERDVRGDGSRTERRTHAAPGAVPMSGAAPTAQGAPTLRTAPIAPVTASVIAPINAPASAPISAPLQAPVRAEARPAESRERAPQANGGRPTFVERGNPGRPEAARIEGNRVEGERGGGRNGNNAGTNGNNGGRGSERPQREGRV